MSQPKLEDPEFHGALTDLADVLAQTWAPVTPCEFSTPTQFPDHDPELAELRRKLCEAEESVECLTQRKKDAEAQASKLKEELEAVVKLLSMVQANSGAASTELRNLKGDKQQLLDEKQRLQHELEGVTAELASLRRELEALQSELQRLQAELERSSAANKRLQNENQTLLQRVAAAQREHQQLQLGMGQQEQLSAQTAASMAELQAQLEQLLAKVAATEAELAREREARLLAEQARDAAREGAHAGAMQQDGLEDELRAAKARVGELERQNAALGEQLTRSDAAVRQLRRDKQEALQQMQDAELRSSKATAAAKLAEEAMAVAQKGLAEAEGASKQAEERRKTAVFEKDEAVVGMEAAEVARDLAEHRREREVGEAVEKAELAEQEESRLRPRVEMLEAQNVQLQAERDSLSDRVVAADEKVAGLGTEKTVLDDQLSELRAELRALKKRLEAAQAEREAALADVAALEAAKALQAKGGAAAADKLAEAELAIQALKDKVSRLNQQLESSTAAGKKAAESLAEAKVQAAHLERQVDRLTQELDEATKRVRDLEQEGKGSQVAAQEAARAIADLQRELQEALRRLEEALCLLGTVSEERDDALQQGVLLRDAAASMQVECKQHRLELEEALEREARLQELLELAGVAKDESEAARDQAVAELEELRKVLEETQATVVLHQGELAKLRPLQIEALYNALRRLVRVRVMRYRVRKFNTLARRIAPLVPPLCKDPEALLASTELNFAQSLGLLREHFTSRLEAQLDRPNLITLRYAKVVHAMAAAHEQHAAQLAAGVSPEELSALAQTLIEWHPQAMVFSEVVEKDTAQVGHPKHLRCAAGSAAWIYKAEVEENQGLGMFAHVILATCRLRVYSEIGKRLGALGAPLKQIQAQVEERAEELAGLVRMQSLLEGCERDFIEMGRKVLREGMIHVASRQCAPAIKYCFLLSDMLLVTQTTSRGTFELEAVLELGLHEYTVEHCPELECYLTLQGPDIKTDEGQLLQHGRWVFKTTNSGDGIGWFEAAQLAGPRAKSVTASTLLDVEGRGQGGVEMQKMGQVRKGIGRKVKQACQPRPQSTQQRRASSSGSGSSVKSPVGSRSRGGSSPSAKVSSSQRQ